MINTGVALKMLLVYLVICEAKNTAFPKWLPNWPKKPTKKLDATHTCISKEAFRRTDASFNKAK